VHDEQAVITSIRHFNRVYTRRVGLLDGNLLRHGYTLAQIRILWEIAHKDHISASEIGLELAMDRAVVSRMLASLKRHGLVRTEVSRLDGRVRHLRLTTQGKQAIRRFEEQTSEDVAAMIGHLSNANRAKLVESMRHVETLLEAAPDLRWQLVLRDPRPGDMGWVVSRHGAVYAQEYGWDATFEALVAEIVAAYVKNHDPQAEQCWIAERDCERVGCIFLVRKSKAVAQLRLLLVEPTARGHGIGARLVDECIRAARGIGYSRLVLWTQSNLHAARRLYKAAGFRITEQEKHESFGAKLTGEYWELDLKAPAT
jgi:DNA-binding MarR family transcriptional regulator/N-acetylglutamate synthase-like GNAT family acetyltransferase